MESSNLPQEPETHGPGSRPLRHLFLMSIWPEPKSSAAGVRVYFLLRALTRLRPQDSICVVASSALDHPACVALKNEFPAFRFESFGPNDPCFDLFVRDLQPDIVQFDRFMVEEQLGWRVFEHCPQALQVLDTSDLHFLRRAREKDHLLGASIEQSDLFALQGTERADWLREMASILRVNHAFVVSDFEEALLRKIQGFPIQKVSVLRWGVEPWGVVPRARSERVGIAMIGNFRHPPNRESVHFFKAKIWPQLKRRFPALQVDIYGAYPSREDQALDEPAAGFFIRGHDQRDAREILSGYIALVAPLGFGAGIKGKVLDAWAAGTPVLTTSIGAEGLQSFGDDVQPFAGILCDRDLPGAWCEALESLIEDPLVFDRYQRLGRQALEQGFQSDRLAHQYVNQLMEKVSEFETKKDFYQLVLQAEERNSKRYLSKYIQLKENRESAAALSPKSSG